MLAYHYYIYEILVCRYDAIKIRTLTCSSDGGVRKIIDEEMCLNKETTLKIGL